MPYATLTIGRVRYNAIKTLREGRHFYLSEADAKDMYDSDIVKPADEEHAVALKQHEAALHKFDESVTVSKGVEIRRDTGGLRKSKVLIDEVFIGRTRHEVEAGRATHFVSEERDKQHPAPRRPEIPTYESWFKSKAAEHRTWRAELITSSGSKAIALPEPFDWSWGFPIAVAIDLLEGLEQEGWKLVSVSEDRGLYSGADATNESYPTRVRYLLHQ